MTYHPNMRRLGVSLATMALLAACGRSRPAAVTQQTAGIPLETPAHAPAATIENLPSPSPLVRVFDRDGNPVVESLPSPGVTPAISGQEAVESAWGRMPSGITPSSVVADFGMLEGHPQWFVTFYGICMPHPAGPPDQSPLPCDPQMTVDIDATTGDWVHSYYYS